MGVGVGPLLTSSHYGDPHLGGLAPHRGDDGAAVLCAVTDGIPQPAEHMGPAIRQCVGLHGNTRLQLMPVLLPDKANIRRTWGAHRPALPCVPEPHEEAQELPWHRGGGRGQGIAQIRGSYYPR